MYAYKTKGVCTREILLELSGEYIQSVEFIGGCSGNTQGVAALAAGMKASDYIEKCRNIKCGSKKTSCPAQLAIALQEALDQI